MTKTKSFETPNYRKTKIKTIKTPYINKFVVKKLWQRRKYLYSDFSIFLLSQVKHNTHRTGTSNPIEYMDKLIDLKGPET